jgi:YbbR domain-containing protein
VAILDLAAARAGRRLFQLSADQVSGPVGLRVVNVLPATLALTFEASVTKTVPIVPVLEGEPAPGYEVGRVAASPAMAQVGGPATAIQRVTEATTEPVLIQGQRTRITERVNVAVADDAVRVRMAQTALVTVEIRPAASERTVEDVPVQVRNLRSGLRADITPERVSVLVKGLGSTVEALAADTIPVFVDLTGLERGSYNLPVRLEPTSRFGVTRVTPERVRVRVR